MVRVRLFSTVFCSSNVHQRRNNIIQQISITAVAPPTTPPTTAAQPTASQFKWLQLIESVQDDDMESLNIIISLITNKAIEAQVPPGQRHNRPRKQGQYDPDAAKEELKPQWTQSDAANYRRPKTPLRHI